MFDVLLVVFVLVFFAWAGPAFDKAFCQDPPKDSKFEKSGYLKDKKSDV